LTSDLGGWPREHDQRDGRRELSFAEIAKTAGKTGGPIVGNAAINAQGAGPSFATHLVDVEVDRETGSATIVRYTAIQDAGKAVHPTYVEGQMQGGAVQGIGWALNEEYIYDADGRDREPGFSRLPDPGVLRRTHDRHRHRRSP
jgi:CO/xanthine dehydrogenase Mo-binding subunit